MLDQFLLMALFMYALPYSDKCGLNGVINGQQIPLVYCFLPDQKTETYKHVIQKILEFDATIFNDKIIICDFEKAEHNAFKELISSCVLRGCYFHFTQAIWKNVEIHHLQQLYLHGKNLKLFFALCFVPAEKVREAYETLADALMEEVEDAEEHVQKNVENFLDYFKKTWTGYTYRRREKNPRYAIDIWNVYETTMNGEPRTNNQAELWHGHLKDTVRIQYPPFYTIVKELQKQHANSNVLRNQLMTGMVFKKNKIHADKDERVLNVVRNFNIETVLDFLKNVNVAASTE